MKLFLLALSDGRPRVVSFIDQTPMMSPIQLTSSSWCWTPAAACKSLPSHLANKGQLSQNVLGWRKVAAIHRRRLRAKRLMNSTTCIAFGGRPKLAGRFNLYGLHLEHFKFSLRGLRRPRRRPRRPRRPARPRRPSKLIKSSCKIGCVS